MPRTLVFSKEKTLKYLKKNFDRSPYMPELDILDGQVVRKLGIGDYEYMFKGWRYSVIGKDGNLYSALPYMVEERITE